MYFISRGNQLGKGTAPSISSNRSREESTWLYLELLNILGVIYVTLGQEVGVFGREKGWGVALECEWMAQPNKAVN